MLGRDLGTQDDAIIPAGPATVKARVVGRAAGRLIAGVAAAICIATAFVPAHRATAGLSMPYDMDHFREIAFAQSVVDGKPLRDPYYRGEWLWYNPLLATTVAVVSKATALPVPAAFVAAGPHLSAAAQIAFFVAAARLLGVWPALAALTLLLFWPHLLPGWATPAITPWIYSSAFSATFLYLGLACCAIALERRRPFWWVMVGASLGLAFLGHTSAALILGLCAVASMMLTPRADITARERAVALALVVGTAVVVSAPFLSSIVGHYGLHVLNRDPLDWVWDDLKVDRARGFIAAGLRSPLALLSIVGAAALVRRSRHDRGALVILCWAATTGALLVYGWIRQAISVVSLPQLVPQHHFYFSFKAAVFALAGAGTWTIITAIVGTTVRRTPWPPLQRGETVIAAIVLLVGVYTFIDASYEAYENRPDVQEYAREARGISRKFDQSRVLTRLRDETPPDAVVLASDEDSYYQVAPAGRAVVSIPSIQSNPYVAQGGRDNDQEQMLDALLAHNLAAFDTIADKYGVTHVLLDAKAAAQVELTGTPQELTELSREGGYTLYARRR